MASYEPCGKNKYINLSILLNSLLNLNSLIVFKKVDVLKCSTNDEKDEISSFIISLRAI